MTDILQDDVKTQGMVRFFWQKGGAAAANPTYLLGTSEAPIGYITGGNRPQTGSINPIWTPRPETPREYELRGREYGPPGLPTWTVEMHEYHGTIPPQLRRLRCPITFYEVSGRCERLDDLDRGWEGYLFVRGDGIAGDTDMGGRGAGAADAALKDSVPFTGSRAYPVGQLAFGEEAAVSIVQEVIDGVYLPATTCGDCGIENDGSRIAYLITRANVGSPSAPGQLVYSVDYGATWQTATITGIGTTNAPTAIDIVGRRLFVVVSGGSQIFYTSINRDTGAPGTWTSVAAGAAYSETWVNGRTVWFCGAAGAIGRTRDIGVAPTLIDNGAGAVVLNRIHGSGQTVVAVGASGTIRVSRNGGASWVTIPLVVSGATITNGLNAIFCVSERRWWVGDGNGRAYVTENAGATWTEVTFQLSGTGAIRDIVFITPEVGYLLHDVSNTAYLNCTVNGGNSWANDGARLLNWPTFQRGNRAVVPTDGAEDVRANTVIVVGLLGVGGDGVAHLGVAPSL